MYEEKQKDHVHVGEAKQVSNHSVLVHVGRSQEKKSSIPCLYLSKGKFTSLAFWNFRLLTMVNAGFVYDS